MFVSSIETAGWDGRISISFKLDMAKNGKEPTTVFG